ncbi:MAG TPA: glycosyltransferase family 2 protein [Opitutaceae bacterium]
MNDANATGHIEVSVVIPCLNEALTVGNCVRRAVGAITGGGLRGEVIVADNGSTDGSRELAAAAGAKVVPIPQRGYGSAIAGGIAASSGRFLVMGDADGSYDFAEVPLLVARLREGHDLVQGCRFPRGGGRIEADAMPFMHRWLGNPVLSFLARIMFRTRLNDVYCGLRGFTRDFYDRAGLRCTGMEFATEMIIKAAEMEVPTSEIPIVLAKDGRQGRKSHLRTFRDGWITLRLFLLCSPDWLFLIPGFTLMAVGCLGAGLSLCAVTVGPATLGVHTLLVSSFLVLLGVQCCFLGIYAHTFAMVKGLRPAGAFITGFHRWFNLEKSLIGSAVLCLTGIAFVGYIFLEWRGSGYGPLSYAHSMRWVISGVALAALSVHIAFGSFMVSVLGMPSR